MKDIELLDVFYGVHEFLTSVTEWVGSEDDHTEVAHEVERAIGALEARNA